MTIPLRGRVVIKEQKVRSSIILDPGVFDPRAQTTHRGLVIAIGEPCLTITGAEIPFDFKAGDVVQFHFEGTEKGRTTTWDEHEGVLVMAQREIDAVIE